MKAAITAVGGYVPEKILTNHDLSGMVDTNDEWITTRTGIKERRILDKHLGTSFMAVKAVRELVELFRVDISDVDMVITATSTPDYAFPSVGNLVCAELGLYGIPSYDSSAACSGFVYTLDQANAFILSGRYKKILVIGADKMSSAMNYEDRNTCILFGDGAGAVLLEPSMDEGIVDIQLGSDGRGKSSINYKGFGSANPLTAEGLAQGQHFFYQDGKAVFKNAVTYMIKSIRDMLDKYEMNGEDLDFLVPHQANIRIMESVAEGLHIPMEKVCLNIREYGNTNAATIPLCLRNYRLAFKKGDKLMLTAFGGGFTWGAAYLTWAI